MFKASKLIEKYRYHPNTHIPGDAQNGMARYHPKKLRIVWSNQLGWEHVSVSRLTKVPSWEDMCFAKQQFWSDDINVMQLHPAKNNYVNVHPNCLHLWRPLESQIPLPDLTMV